MPRKKQQADSIDPAQTDSVQKQTSEEEIAKEDVRVLLVEAQMQQKFEALQTQVNSMEEAIKELQGYVKILWMNKK